VGDTRAPFRAFAATVCEPSEAHSAFLESRRQLEAPRHRCLSRPRSTSRQRRSRRVERRCATRAGTRSSDPEPAPPNRRPWRSCPLHTGAGQLAYLTRALRVGATWAEQRAFRQHHSLPCWGWAA
jgi:hypothetical protein